MATVFESCRRARSSAVRAATWASSLSWAPEMLSAMASNERESSPSSPGSAEPTRAVRSPAASARLACVSLLMGSMSSAREKAVAATRVTAVMTAKLMSVLRRMAPTVARSASASAWPTVAGSPGMAPASKPEASMPTAASARHRSMAVATANTNTTPSSRSVSRAERRWCQRSSSVTDSGLTHHPPLPDGVQGGLGAALQSQLGEHVRDVRFHGGFADAQLLSHALVAGAHGHQLQDLQLALGERLPHLGRPDLAHQSLLRARIQAHLAPGRGAHGLEQLVGPRLLQHVAAGAGLHHVDDQAVLQHAREGHHLHVGMVAADGARGVHTVHDGHQQVHHHHVRLQLLDLGQRFLTVGGLAHDLQVVLQIERQAQAAPDDGVIVDQQDAYGGWVAICHLVAPCRAVSWRRSR